MAKRRAEVQNGCRLVMKGLAQHLAQDAQSPLNVPDVV